MDKINICSLNTSGLGNSKKKGFQFLLGRKRVIITLVFARNSQYTYVRKFVEKKRGMTIASSVMAYRPVQVYVFCLKMYPLFML